LNVYDFDGTIYAGDCTLDFWKFCVLKYPKALLALPGALYTCLQFKLGRKSREHFKEKFYQFLRYVPDVKKQVEAFWNINYIKIKPWYYEQHKDNDLVISASPEFLIAEICKRLKIDYIASKVDWQNGRLLGPNCRGEEKVAQFKLHNPNEIIDEFYSDSKADEPLARLAKQAFLVKREVLQKWQFKNES